MPKVLLVVSGSIAACKVPEIISSLKTNKSIELKCVLTQGGSKFITAETLACLSGNEVFTNAFESPEQFKHIELARWADLIVVLPASASLIGRWRAGLGDDLASMLFLADGLKTPTMIFPAMNTAMWEHPITQANCNQLSEWGVRIIQPAKGVLACGEIGSGRLPEVTDVVTEIESVFKASRSRLLISYGGINVPIDAMRNINNRSSGQTGKMLADAFSKNGYQVDCLHSISSPPAEKCNNIEVKDFEDYSQKLNSNLKTYSYSAVLLLAAVPDYAPVSIQFGDQKLFVNDLQTTKLPSSKSDTMLIECHRTPKIIDQIKASQNAILIGFKYTAEKSQGGEAVKSLFSHSSADYILHNWQSGISTKNHFFNLYNKDMQIVESGSNKPEMFSALQQVLEASII